jgi:ferrous iron transport protein A
MLQVSFKSGSGREPVGSGQRRRLAELRTGETGVLDGIDLPEDVTQRLMELGFLPGHIVTPAHSAPGGDPRVFRVDGSEIALRRETAASVWVRAASMAAD